MREADKRYEASRLTTDRLLVLPDTGVVRTTSPVLLENPAARVEASGLELNNQTRTLKLDRVRATYKPRPLMRESPSRLPVAATLLLAAVALAAAPPARAEKADREKEIQVLADRLSADDAKKEAVYEGNVVITQGTMRITSAKIVVREDPEGYRKLRRDRQPGDLPPEARQGRRLDRGLRRARRVRRPQRPAQALQRREAQELAGRAHGRLHLLRPRQGVLRGHGRRAGLAGRARVAREGDDHPAEEGGAGRRRRRRRAQPPVTLKPDKGPGHGR